MMKDSFDLDLLLKCAKEYGAEVRLAKPGEGGIYVNGKKMTTEELFSDIDKYEGENMRSKDRIRPFCERLAAAWERYPDMRFGQLISNAFSVSNMGIKKDPFFLEDDVTIFLIEKLTETKK